MVGGSLRALWLLSPLKLVANDITEILLKVAFNTITLNPTTVIQIYFNT
jgi:hypothetical protein